MGQTEQVIAPVGVWIDEVDSSFQELVCYINTPDGRTSAIWRSIEKHTTLHAGLNSLISLHNAANENLIQRIFSALTTLLTGMFEQYTQYIGSAGSIIQGWTQSWRLCETKWDLPDLENPEQQEPDEDDEDDWLPRYEIFTKAGTSISALRGLEHALGGGGSELATADEDKSLIMGYVVDLNIMQASLPQTMPFVNWTLRFVWDGSDDDSDSAFDISLSDMSFYDSVIPRYTSRGETDLQDGFSEHGLQDNGSHARSETPSIAAKRQAPWNEFGYPEPVGSSRQELTPEDISLGHYLKSISQQKGQNLDTFNYHTYASNRGEGSWIFIVDFGYSLDHKVRGIA